ncbi:universal stress protein [Nisaea acidiphila]|uniref:Universal stress protein n=1 Tax=Nisaea acidiphila TaxID=1862145 RepID=A0A9J7AVX8_9PROT|nr:universal stress protein [Nisaea acidiphila]UUX51503.1 universal stress protein [Nisaea acidiphila]
MSLKTVLAPVLGNEADAAILNAALAVATPHGAHVFVAHIHRDPRDVLVPQVGMGMSASMIETLVDQAESFANEARAASLAAFDKWREDNKLVMVEKPTASDGVTVSFETLVGEPTTMVAQRSRMVDVICVIAPTEREGSDAMAIAEAAMLQSGKATMVVPHDVEFPAVKTIAVGWNASKEAAAAIAHAMPLLETADKVLVMSGIDSELTEEKLSVFVDSLLWHGVKAEAKTFDASSGSISGRLQAEAREAGAQLLVLGAYSHSRFRESIFGGVTDDVLTETRIPVLMAH